MDMEMEDLSHLLSEPDPVLDAIMEDDEGDEGFSIFLQSPVKAVHRYKDNAAAPPGQLTLELKIPLEGSALSYKNSETNFKSGLAQALGLTVASIQKTGEPVQESGNTVVDFNVSAPLALARPRSSLLGSTCPPIAPHRSWTTLVTRRCRSLRRSSRQGRPFLLGAPGSWPWSRWARRRWPRTFAPQGRNLSRACQA
jgi:hypothetical protein